MTKPQTAMILAAGFGRRMLPLTKTRPKPLIPVAGKALIDHCLDDLVLAGVERAIVNIHYLGDQIETHLAARARPEIIISDERDAILDTGGGIVRALPQLGNRPFYLRNSDSFWLSGVRSNLDWLAHAWDDTRMDALLLLAEAVFSTGYQGRGDFLLDKNGLVSRRPERTVAPHVYAGGAILHPRLFDRAPRGAFSLNSLFDEAIESGRLFGISLDGVWINVEYPGAIPLAEAAIAEL